MKVSASNMTTVIAVYRTDFHEHTCRTKHELNEVDESAWPTRSLSAASAYAIPLAYLCEVEALV